MQTSYVYLAVIKPVKDSSLCSMEMTYTQSFSNSAFSCCCVFFFSYKSKLRNPVKICYWNLLDLNLNTNVGLHVYQLNETEGIGKVKCYIFPVVIKS